VTFTEDKTFTLRFSLEVRFPDDYDGEEDGYAWLKAWDEEMKPEVLKAVRSVLRRHSGWSIHVRNRGMSQEDEIEFAMSKDFSGGSSSVPEQEGEHR